MPRLVASFDIFSKKAKVTSRLSKESPPHIFDFLECKTGLGEVPEEILEHILECIPPGRLVQYIRVNKAMYRIGLPILYRHIYIHHPHRELALYKTLIEDKEHRLAPLIKEFRRSARTQICCNMRKGICRAVEPFVHKKFNTTLSGLQGRALALAVNLQSLEIALGPLVQFDDNRPPSADDPKNDPFAHVRWLLDGTVKLKKLIAHPLEGGRRWNGLSESHWKEYFRAILRAQSSLEHLDLSKFPVTIWLYHLPNLQSFSAYSANHLIKSLLRERPVKRLALQHGTLSSLEGRVIASKQGGEHVMEFAWEGYPPTQDEQIPDLNFIGCLFPNLQVLKLCVINPNFYKFVKNVLKLLAVSSHLVRLDLDGCRNARYQAGVVESAMIAQNGKAITFQSAYEQDEPIMLDKEGKPVRSEDKASPAKSAMRLGKLFTSRNKRRVPKGSQFMCDEAGKVIEKKDYIQEHLTREKNAIREFHKHCPTLLQIVLPSGQYWFRRDFEQEWTRSESWESPRDFRLFKGDSGLPIDRGDTMWCFKMGDVMNHP